MQVNHFYQSLLIVPKYGILINHWSVYLARLDIVPRSLLMKGFHTYLVNRPFAHVDCQDQCNAHVHTNTQKLKFQSARPL